MELISVIVPIYNAEKYLSNCIKSIINQTYKNIEIFLINDGSNDNSLMICKSYEINDNRIKVIDKSNSGVSNSRNKGLELSKAKYVTFVDADDCLNEEFLSIMYRQLIIDNADAIFCNYYLNYNGKLIKKAPRLKQGEYRVNELHSYMIDDGTISGILFGNVWAALYKRKIILERNINFLEHIKNNEDGVFNLEFLMNSNKISVIDDHLYYYSIHENSLSNNSIIDNKTKDATNEIRLLFTEKYKISNLQNQLSKRHVSESFWQILNICNKNNKLPHNKIKRKIIEILNDDKLVESLRLINTKNLNRHKFLYYILIRMKSYNLIIFLTKYITPIFEKVFNH